MDGSARVTRLRRGVSAASLSTAIALVFHMQAGGAMPGVLGVAMPLILTSFVGMLAGGTRPNLAGMLATTMTAQFLFHALFTFDAPAGTGSAAHVHHAGGLPDLGSSAAAGDAWMWQMHVAAAVVTALVLHRGELLLAWLRRCVRALHRELAGAIPAPPPLPAQRRTACAPPAATPLTWVLADLVRRAPRRGPPVLIGT